MEPADVHEELKRLLVENHRLLVENNQLLTKMHRSARLAMVVRVLWFVVILGAPVALYYFVLEPNLASLQSSLSILEEGAKNVTGLQDLFQQVQP
jgi:lipid-A-disaccharide synthase-like uncharacterized protein